MNKFYTNLVILLSVSFTSACSMAPKPAPVIEKREIASKEYECKFEEELNGEMTTFIFSPDSLKLSISSKKIGQQTLILEEDSFISGGVTYIASAGNPKSTLSVKKIEFTSFVAKPSIVVSMKKGNKLTRVAKSCRS